MTDNGSALNARRGILTSPAEPPLIRTIGRSSVVPEKYGADVLIPSLRLAIQRKEFSDLVNSLTDGRLAKESMQLQRMSWRFLIVEGRPRWTADGEWVSGFQRFTRDQYRGLLYSLQDKEISVLQTEDMRDTRQEILHIISWVEKQVHAGLQRRPNATSKWGTADAEDWCLWFLQGFPGVGPTLARNIYEHYNKQLPIAWKCSKESLEKVPGLGRNRVSEMFHALPLGTTDDWWAPWLAALIDGEGTVSMPAVSGGAGWKAQVSIHNTFLPLLERVKELTRVGRVLKKPSSELGKKQNYVWICSSRDALAVLKAARPYMIVKADAADAVIEWQSGRSLGRGGKEPLTEEELRRGEELRQRVLVREQVENG